MVNDERGGRVSAAPGSVDPAADDDIVARATVERPGRTLLLARLAGIPVSDRLRGEVVAQARRRIVRDVVAGRLRLPRRLRSMDTAALVKAPASATQFFRCTCRPRGICAGCGTLRRSIRDRRAQAQEDEDAHLAALLAVRPERARRPLGRVDFGYHVERGAA